MSGKDQISFKITDINRGRLDDFKERNNFQSYSDALNEIMTLFFSEKDQEARVRAILDEYVKRPDLEVFLNDLIDKRLAEKFLGHK